MKYLPQEITQAIVDRVGKYDDCLSRQDLRNLRLVNKNFSQFATPVLFQTVPFWLGLSSLKHLTLISEHPFISNYVTKLLFSPLRFVEWEDPFSYQGPVRNRFERDTFSHNIFSLSFGEHVAAYKRYIAAQDYLSKDSQDTKILTRALRRLPRLKNVTVVFNNKVIGAREIMLAFGLLSGNEVTLDAEYTLSVLIEALCESAQILDTFNLLSNDSPSFEFFYPSRRNFNDRHETRFEYISESPGNVTASALWDSLNYNSNRIPLRAVQPMSRLREFKMSGLEIGSDASDANLWSDSLGAIVAFASGLEHLSIDPSVSEADERDNQRLALDVILHYHTPSSCLRSITLSHIESSGSLLVDLSKQCSRTLVSVVVTNVLVFDGGSWSGVLRESRNADFKVLSIFALNDCDGIKGCVRAHHYLKRTSDQDPLKSLT